MRLSTIILLFIISSFFIHCSGNRETVDRQRFSKEVEELLKGMSLEEKVGQMTQVNVHLILKGGYGSVDGTVSDSALKVAVKKYKVGSILNATPSAYSLDHWHKIIIQIQDAAMKSESQIPVLYGIDAIHGATYTVNSTLIPHNIGLAASRDLSLAYQGAKMTAKEVRASGIRWNFDPCLDVGRQPLWSRFKETFGEDPLLVAGFGAEVIKGYEEDGLKSPTAVASCMKHYLGYSMPRTGKDRTPAYIPEIELREIFLLPFKKAVEAGSSSIMINSGEVSGVPVHANPYLLKTVLRDELGFKGLVVSDWEDIIRLHTRHFVASTPKEAVKMGVMAGIDMSMAPADYSFYELLIELVEEGEVPLWRIDEAAGRVLQLKMDLGLFENAYPEEEAIKNFGLSEYDTLAREAARGALILLKNKNNTLPLNKNSRILLAGPALKSKSTLSGSWSYLWQGNEDELYPEDFGTIYEAFADYMDLNSLSILNTGNFDSISYSKLELNSKAKNADVFIACIGEDAYAESPGVIDDLTLPIEQLNLVEDLMQTGKPVILILSEGRPRLFTRVADRVEATLLALRPGSEGAHAIVETLFGEHSPYAKLPFTYHKSTGDLVPYDAKGTDMVSELNPGVIGGGGYKPLYPFGHGLSYSVYQYSNLQADKATFTANDTITVAIDIKNNGPFDGKVAVDLFARDKYASVTPSVKKLRAFKVVRIKNGEEKNVQFKLTAKDFSFVNQELERVTEPGEFDIMIDKLVTTITYQ